MEGLNVGVPPKTGDFKDIPTDIYEFYVEDFETVPNKFYDPEKDKDNKKYQIKWRFIIRDEGEYKGLPLSYYTGSHLGRHPRNKLTNLVKLLDENFDIDVAYNSTEEFRDKVLYGIGRATVNAVEYTKDDGTKGSFPKVTGVLPSKMKPMDTSEILGDKLGAEEVPI